MIVIVGIIKTTTAITGTIIEKEIEETSETDAMIELEMIGETTTSLEIGTATEYL